MPTASRVRAHISLALLNLLVLGGALYWVRDPRASAVKVVAPPTPSPAPPSTPVQLYVYVTGAVKTSRVVAVSDGARVEDAVSACGGLAADADPAIVNLAAPLADGQHVHVPAEGEDPSLYASSAGASSPNLGGTLRGTSLESGAQAVTSSGSAININTASVVELETLPGVGPALAGRIVAYRDTNGAFASVDDLLGVSGIGSKTLDRFRDMIRVR